MNHHGNIEVYASLPRAKMRRYNTYVSRALRSRSSRLGQNAEVASLLYR